MLFLIFYKAPLNKFLIQIEKMPATIWPQSGNHATLTLMPKCLVYSKPSSVKCRLSSKVIFHQMSPSIKGGIPSKVVFHQRSSSVKRRLPSKVVFRQRSSFVKGHLPSNVVFHQRSLSIKGSFVSNVLYSILIPVATLPTSPEANIDRQTEKATYRGSSYCSAQK